RLADHHGTLGVEALDDGGRVHRDVSLEDARARRGRDLLRADDVLARPRDPREERPVARAEARIGRARLLARLIVGTVQPRVITVAVRSEEHTSELQSL